MASGDLAIDSDNNSPSGDPTPHYATDVNGVYVDDPLEDLGEGMYISVHAPLKDSSGNDIVDPLTNKPAADPATRFVPMDVIVNDFTPEEEAEPFDEAKLAELAEAYEKEQAAKK